MHRVKAELSVGRRRLLCDVLNLMRTVATLQGPDSGTASSRLSAAGVRGMAGYDVKREMYQGAVNPVAIEVALCHAN
jgi:hypothetical protein